MEAREAKELDRLLSVISHNPQKCDYGKHELDLLNRIEQMGYAKKGKHFDQYSVTNEGAIHINSGGFSAKIQRENLEFTNINDEIKYRKWSFALSVAAIIISVIALIISIVG